MCSHAGILLSPRCSRNWLERAIQIAALHVRELSSCNIKTNMMRHLTSLTPFRRYLVRMKFVVDR